MKLAHFGVHRKVDTLTALLGCAGAVVALWWLVSADAARAESISLLGASTAVALGLPVLRMGRVLFFALGEEGTPNLLVFSSTGAAEQTFKEFALHEPSHKIVFLSLGLASRWRLIVDFLNMGLDVDAIVRSPRAAVSQQDKEIERFIQSIQANFSPSSRRPVFRILRSNNTATLRAVMSIDAKGELNAAVLSWYTYEQGNARTGGDAYPALFVNRPTKQTAALLQFCADKLSEDEGSSDGVGWNLIPLRRSVGSG